MGSNLESDNISGSAPTLPESSATNGCDYLRDKLNQRITVLHGSVGWFRRRYYMATMSAVVLSASITIVAGMEGDWVNKYFAKNLVVAMGALSTVLSAWGAFFSPRDSWHLYADTLAKLRGLQARLAFTAANSGGVKLDPTETTKFFDEYQAILIAHNTRWAEIRSKGNS